MTTSTPTQVFDLGVSSDETQQILQAFYDVPTEDELTALEADIEENGFVNPLDPSSAPLSGYQKYVLRQLGKILFFVAFHIPIP